MTHEASVMDEIWLLRREVEKAEDGVARARQELGRAYDKLQLARQALKERERLLGR